MKVNWILREDGLAAAVQRIRPSADALSPYLWAGCENAAFRQLRRYARDELGLKKGSHNIVAYWREGQPME